MLGSYLRLLAVAPAAAARKLPAAMLSVVLLLLSFCFCGDASLHCSDWQANLWANSCKRCCDKAAASLAQAQDGFYMIIYVW
jgi:hypothetical protein